MLIALNLAIQLTYSCLSADSQISARLARIRPSPIAEPSAAFISLTRVHTSNIRARVRMPTRLCPSAKIFPNASSHVSNSPIAIRYRMSFSAAAAHSGTGSPFCAYSSIAHKSICLSPALNRSSKEPSSLYAGSIGQGEGSPLIEREMMSFSGFRGGASLISAPAPVRPH